MRSHAWAIGIGLALAAGGIEGCGRPPGKRPQPLGGQPVDGQVSGPVSVPVPVTPLDVSQSRERAIQLIEELSEHADGQVRGNAVEAAASSPKRLAPIIARGLKDTTPGVRSIAAMAVARGKMGEHLGTIRTMLKDPSAHVRASAILASERLGNPVNQQPLANMLLNDPSPWVNRHAAFVLGELGNPSAVGLLKSAAKNGALGASPGQQRALQLQVTEALVKLGEDDLRAPIRAALYPGQPDELEATALAVQILGQLKDREAIGQLQNLADYKDRAGNMYPAEVRLAIAGALAHMGVDGGATIADAFAKSPQTALRAQAASVYGELPGRQRLDALVAMMDDPEATVRISAAAGILKTTSK